MTKLASLSQRIGITAVLCLAGCTTTLSRATSPDGRWTVEVRGYPRPLGGVEVTMRRKGPGGESEGVIDLCSSWSEAKERYGTIDIDDERAVVHDRVERFNDGSGAGQESAGTAGLDGPTE